MRRMLSHVRLPVALRVAGCRLPVVSGCSCKDHGIAGLGEKFRRVCRRRRPPPEGLLPREREKVAEGRMRVAGAATRDLVRATDYRLPKERRPSVSRAGNRQPATGNQTRQPTYEPAAASSYGVMSKLRSYIVWMRSISSSLSGACSEASTNSASCVSS
jgi:hypothetical protein